MPPAYDGPEPGSLGIYLGQFDTAFKRYELVVGSVNDMYRTIYVLDPFIGWHGKPHDERQRHKGQIALGHLGQAVVRCIQDEHSRCIG